MAGDIRVGGAYVTYSAQAGPYVAGTNQVIAANRRVVASMVPLAEVADRFRASITASLIATAAYAAGVGTVAVAFRNSVGSLLDFDQGLIAVQKTTGLADDALGRLSERLVDINTTGLYGRQAINLLNQDLLAIATAVGQAGITDVGQIATLTQAAAALQVSSDLIGTDAVRSITRYLEVTGQGIDRTNALASAVTNLGNNAVATESEILEFARRIAQETSGVGRLSDTFILGLATTFQEAGARIESSSTVMQRSINAINNLVTDRRAFISLGELAGVAADEMEVLRDEFVEGIPTARSYERALTILFRALSQIPKAAEEGSTFQGLIRSVFGDSNTRISSTLGLLSSAGLGSLDENLRLAEEGLTDMSFHFEEAEKAADSYRGQIQILSNELSEIGRDIAQTFLPSLIAIAQNFNVLGGAAAGLGASLVLGFGGRAVSNNLAQQRKETNEATKSLKLLNQERLQNNKLFAEAKNLRRSDLQLQRERSRINAQIAEQDATRTPLRGFTFSGYPEGAFRIRQEQRRLADLDKEQIERRKRLAEIDRQRATVLSRSSGVPIKDLRNEARVTRLTERAKRRLARAQEKATESTRIYNEQLRIARRNNNLFLVGTRGLVNAFRTLLSPVNLLIFALPVIGGVLAKVLDDFKKTETSFKNVETILEDIERSTLGLTLDQQQAQAIRTEFESIEKQIESLNDAAEMSRIELGSLSIGREGQQTQVFSSYQAQADELLDRLNDLRQRAEELNVELAAPASAEAGIKQEIESFKAFNQEVALAGRQVLRFKEEFNAQLDRDLEAARNQFIDANTVGLSTQEQIYRDLRRSAIGSLEAERQRLELTLREAEVANEVRQSQLERAQNEADRVKVGSEGFEQATKQLETAEANAKAASDNLEIAREALKIGRFRLILTLADNKALKEQARLRSDARFAELLNFRPDTRLSESVGEVEEANNLRRSLESQLSALERRVELEKILLNLSDKRAAGERAAADAFSNFYESVNAQQGQIERLQTELVDRAGDIARYYRAAEQATGREKEDLLIRARTLREQQNQQEIALDLEQRKLAALQAQEPVYRSLSQQIGIANEQLFSILNPPELEETLEELLKFQEAFRLPETVGVTEPARDILRLLEDQNAALLEQINLERLIRNFTDDRAAGVTAAVEAEKQYLDSIQNLEREIELSQRQLRERSVDIQNYLEAVQALTGPERDSAIERITTLREESAEQERSLEFMQRQLAILEDQYPQIYEQLLLTKDLAREWESLNNNVEPLQLFPETTDLSLEFIDFSQLEVVNQQIQGSQAEVLKLAELVDNNLVSAFGHLENALVDTFKSGEFEIKNLVEAIANDLIRSLVRTVIVANLARAVLSSFSNFFGVSPTPAPGGGTNPALPGIPSFHSGGVIRYASPGLRSNEAFAILERGEEVITRTDPRHRWNLRGQNPDFLRWWISRLPRYHSGGVVGGTGSAPSPIGMPVEVRVINPPGEPVAEVQSSQAVLDSDKLVVSVMVRDAQRNGPITRTIRNIAKRG